MAGRGDDEAEIQEAAALREGQLASIQDAAETEARRRDQIRAERVRHEAAHREEKRFVKFSR